MWVKNQILANNSRTHVFRNIKPHNLPASLGNALLAMCVAGCGQPARMLLGFELVSL